MLNFMLHSLQPSPGAVNFILAQLYIGVYNKKGKLVKADPFKGESTPVSTGSISLVWQIEW